MFFCQLSGAGESVYRHIPTRFRKESVLPLISNKAALAPVFRLTNAAFLVLSFLQVVIIGADVFVMTVFHPKSSGNHAEGLKSETLI